MTTLHNIARPPAQLATKLHKLEWQGRYNEALQDCLELIDGKACIPAFDEVTQRERAELLLRYGALIGFCGHISQVADSQEQSKDLLTRALGEFIDLRDEEKIAECENYIALAYWRIGELNESLVWLDSSLKRNCSSKSGTRLHGHLIRALINLEKKDFEKNVDLLESMEDVYLEHGDAFLLGNYYTNLGISLKDLGRTTAALRCLKLSRYYNGKAGHKIYQGISENNLAQLYWLIGDFEKSHRAIDNATRIFRNIEDKTREGFSFDTKANIFIAEKKYANALRSIEKAVNILKRGENAAYLVEALLTKAKTLLYLDRFADSILVLVEAIEINRIKIGEESVRKLIDEFAEVLEEVSALKPAAGTIASTKGALNLLIPASLAHYPSYSGVWVQSSSLDRFGLKKGSLAIVVNESVQRGDLVAIEEQNNGSIHCGVFDREFGLVCLDKGDDEPQLFDENHVKILGKIVGVGGEDSIKDGDIVIKPLAV
jgi:tetratricopeptide (TPR) repeat protein